MAIMETFVAELPPLQTDKDGVVRVGGTRVPLDTVVEAFNTGYQPEEIVLSYPSLRLDDIYAVIAYYLRHREEIEVYLERRRQEAEEVRREVEARFPMHGIRERLLARRNAK